MSEENRKILIIDDDQGIWRAYRNVLDYVSAPANSATQKLADLLADHADNHDSVLPIFDLHFASQGQDGFAMVQQAIASGCPFSTAFIDVRMPPGWDGMETAYRIRQFDPEIEIVIVTAYTDRSREEIVQHVGCPAKLLFLRKPFDPEELYQMALSLSEKWRLGRQDLQNQSILADSEARFRGLVENSSDFVWEVDNQGRFTYCSPICQEIYGYTPQELLGNIFFEFLMDDTQTEHYRNLFTELTRKKQSFKAIEFCCQHRNGGKLWIESSGIPILDNKGNLDGFRGIDRDISGRRKLQQQFLHAQKMEAVGRLSGGVAHDFNNILTTIIGYSELALLKMDQETPWREDIEMVRQAGLRASDLTRQLLAFSRKQVLEMKVVNFNDLVNNMAKMLTRLIGEDIELILRTQSLIGNMTADPNQLEQIIMNLVVNARDAMPNGGQLIIETTAMEVDNEYSHRHLDLKPGSYVTLSLSDTGEGMSKEVQERIFEPFFTTKDKSRGTGLGLATIYGIVKQHHGYIYVYSEQGIGTTFKIFFPVTTAIADDIAAKAISENMKGGTETILVVDDETAIRNLVLDTLRPLGYQVFGAANGQQALKVSQQIDKKLDLLLTDIIMPGMSGRELAETMLSMRPGLKVVYMSGYTADIIAHQGVLDSGIHYIPKPLMPHALADKLREVLDQK